MNKNKSFSRKLFSGSLWALFIRVFTVLSNLAINVLIARLLKPQEVGAYFLLVSVVSMVTIFALAGTERAIVRIIAESTGRGEPGRARTAVRKSFLIIGTTSLVTAALFYLFGFKLLIRHVFHVQLLEELTLIGAIWVIFWSFESLTAEMFRGFQQIHLAVVFKRLAPNILVVSGVLIGSLLREGWTLKQFTLLVLFAWIASVLLSAWMILRYSDSMRGAGKVGVSEILKLSWPMWIVSFVTFSLPQVDLWLVAFFETAEVVAVYGAASRLFRFVAVPLLIVQSVVPPLIAEMHARGETSELEKGLRTAATLSFIPGSIIIAAYMFFGDFILRLVYGSYYSQGTLILQILSIGMLTRILSGSSQSTLMMTGHERLMMQISIFSGLVMMLGGICVGGRFGETGIAIAVTVSITLQSLLSLFYAKKMTGIWNLPRFYPMKAKVPAKI